MTYFIAIDGEGDDKETITLAEGTKRSYQDYTVLCSSIGEDSALYRHTYAWPGPRNRLDTYTCLIWLTDLAIANQDATFIGYGLSYDITMILRDLTFEQLSRLHRHAKSNGVDSFIPVQCGAFALRYVPRKFLEITRYKHTIKNGRLTFDAPHKTGKGAHSKEIECRMTLWDTIGFFQGTFLQAIEDYALPVDDIDFIREMKAARGTFQTLQTADIVRYSTRECQILVQLMEKLDGYLHHPEIDVKLTKWGGAGYIASALLKKYGVKEHLEDPPKHVLQAALIAFSGGRIELVRYGHSKGKVFDHDINSCYPAAMVNFPALAGGKWMHNVDIDGARFELVHVRWSLWDPERRIYPFAYRCEDDSIIYPSSGETWCWLPEYQAAMKHLHKYKGGTIEVLESFSFLPRIDDKGYEYPFSFIAGLASQRLEWKRQFRETNGREGGQHHAVKLGLNSLYGKCVQQVGGYISDEKTTLPPFHSMVYGGHITAYGRAKVYDAAMQNEDAIIMFATDGIFSSVPLDVENGSGIGQWELSQCDDILIAQSGVYFYQKGGEWFKKTRGFMADSVTLNSILDGWISGQSRLTLSSKRFVTFGMLATASLPTTKVSSMARLCSWEQKNRDLSLTSFGTKRYNRLNDEYTTRRNAANGLLATYPRINETPDVCSKPYEYIYLKKWDELTEEQQEYLQEREGIENERA